MHKAILKKIDFFQVIFDFVFFSFFLFIWSLGIIFLVVEPQNKGCDLLKISSKNAIRNRLYDPLREGLKINGVVADG